jgi:hypothetical protein
MFKVNFNDSIYSFFISNSICLSVCPTAVHNYTVCVRSSWMTFQQISSYIRVSKTWSPSRIALVGKDSVWLRIVVYSSERRLKVFKTLYIATYLHVTPCIWYGGTKVSVLHEDRHNIGPEAQLVISYFPHSDMVKQAVSLPGPGDTQDRGTPKLSHSYRQSAQRWR